MYLTTPRHSRKKFGAKRLDRKQLLRAGVTAAAIAGNLAYIVQPVIAIAETFSLKANNYNPFSAISTSGNSRPVFVDIDGDNDLDLLLGSKAGTIQYYQNTNGVFSKIITDPFSGTKNPLDVVNETSNSAPAFVDIDADGDMDAFIGNHEGKVSYYPNSGSATDPVFSKASENANPLASVNMGSNATPMFTDINRDGDMDLFIGSGQYGAAYVPNTGTAQSPFFDTSKTWFFTSLNNAAPTAADYDGDGDMDIFVGYTNGVAYYETDKSIERSSSPLHSTRMLASPAVADIDKDGELEAAMGNSQGDVLYYDSGVIASKISVIILNE